MIPGDGGAGLGRSDIKRSMEKPLKKGWLKKRRSIVKNWKPCYFVLRGNVLTYHKDDRESAVQVRNERVARIYALYSTFKNRHCHRAALGKSGCTFRPLMNDLEETAARKSSLKAHDSFHDHFSSS